MSVGAFAQTPMAVMIKSFEELPSFPRRSPSISRGRVCAIVSTFSYVYLASDQSLWFFFNSCFAQTFSTSLTKTNFGPAFRLLCNFEWGSYNKPCDRKSRNISITGVLRYYFWLKAEIPACFHYICMWTGLSPIQGCLTPSSEMVNEWPLTLDFIFI